MTAHELARKLLEGPDVPVFYDYGSWGTTPVQTLEEILMYQDSYGDWHHDYQEEEDSVKVLEIS
jgi:hypothetical protein